MKNTFGSVNADVEHEFKAGRCHCELRAGCGVPTNKYGGKIHRSTNQLISYISWLERRTNTV